jgi:hypothetical protein
MLFHLFVDAVETTSLYVYAAQAGLELLGSSDTSASASQVAEDIGTYHCTQVLYFAEHL